MNKLVLKYLLCFLFASYISVISQIKIHKSLTTADGLISGEIYRMMQDSKGYIWFATSDGASKWDGTNFENFHLNNGLTSSQVFFIEEGFNDEIFLATFGTGVTVYNNGKIDTLNQKNGFPSNYITVIHRSKNGGVYFCAEDIIFLYKNGKYTNWSSQYQIRLFGVVNILETSDSSIFIATTNGLVRIKNDSIKTFYKKDGLKHNSITGIAEGLDGTIHIGTMGGINRFRNNIFSGLQLQGKEINDNIYEVIVSKDGTVYYMSSNGVIVNSNNNVQRLQEWNGLSNNHVWSALEDRSGNLYFGTSGYGVSIYSPDKIDNFNSSHGLGNTNITSLVEDNLKQLIVGTENGLFIKGVNSIVFESFNNKFSGVAITSLFKSSEDKIYIGTKTGITIATQKEKGNYKIELEKNIGKISSIKEDISQNIIVGTESGVKVFLPKSFKEIKPDIKLSNYFINALLVTKDSSVIYGYHGKGLTINKNNKLFHYDESNGLTNGIINSLCERRDGSIWIGTQQGGLYILDNDGIHKFERTHELLSNTIYGIVEDDLENLFVSTPKGVNILVKKGEDFFIRTLTKDDGLVSDACNRNALVKDKNGKIWIGTKDGLTHFDPTKDSNSFIPPVIYFTNFSIYNTPYGLEYLNDVPQLNYDENYLTLSYRSINLSSPKKIIYYYHLKGVDKNWITTENNSIMFSNLDDGSYTLEIKCKNEWDQFSKTIEANFVINPAWWETWWFYLLTLLAITSFITFIVSNRYRNLLAVERIRTKISEDLHDNIGSGLSQISILTELMNLQLKDEKSEFKEHLKKVNSISGSLVENMSDIVWLINPKRNSLKELILRLRDSYNEILEFSQIDFDIENLDSLEEIHLSINYRQHLYLILKEAVNNSIKYSKADLLKIDINVKKNFLNICYSDNGKGFDITKVKYGNGIKNIKKRAADIGAKLDYFSEIGKGTKITFSGRIRI